VTSAGPSAAAHGSIRGHGAIGGGGAPSLTSRAAGRRWPGLAVAFLWAAAVGLASPGLRFQETDLRLLAVLAACAVAATLARPPGDRRGGLLSLWCLPAAVLLPPAWALIVAAPLAALDRWRAGRAPAWWLTVTGAAEGLGYGGASLAFHAVTALAGHWLAAGLPGWLAAVIGCGVLQRAASRALATAPSASRPTGPAPPPGGRAEATGWLAELSASVLATAAIAASPWCAVPAVLVALARSRQHARLAAAARTDAKTGLLNAGAWQQAAAAEAARAARSGRSLAVAMVDIDHFKKVNDTWGHLVGDQVLAAVARILAGQLRPYDVAGRFGGEEFAVLLPDATEATARLVAERMRASIATTNPMPGTTLQVTVSIGVAAAVPARENLRDLVAAADEALYAAKQAGRNRVRQANPGPR
jgi:diguanylate cyclase (GGDEF)-like protein